MHVKTNVFTSEKLDSARPARGQEERIVMERKLTVVVMAIAAVSATLAFGQAAVRERISLLSMQGGGSSIAGKSGWERIGLNQIQDALSGAIIGHQTSALNDLESSKARDAVILSCN